MDLTLLHPKIVHLPIALAVLMPAIAGGILLAWWRGALPGRAWLIAVLLQGTLAVSGFAALQTGEADEERVEKVVQESAIEAHAEAGEAFVWGAGVAFVLALGAFGALMMRKEGAAQGAALAAGVAMVVVLGLGYRVGEAGGALVYEHNAARAFLKAGADTALPSAAPRQGDDDNG